MFPLNSNMPYIKDTGERDKLGNVIGSGGGSELPEYSETDAGKVLGIDEDGDLAWVTVSGGNQFSFAPSIYENWNVNGKAGGVNAN